MLDLKPTDSVLDLGCGDGLLISQFKNYCTKITGVDNSEESLKLAFKINPDAEFINEDIAKLDLPKKSYDVVYCFEVLQYIQQQQLVLKKMMQLARRSVVFSVPDFDSFWGQITKLRQILFGVKEYPDSSVKQWFRKNQLKRWSNTQYMTHSLASRLQNGFQGYLKYSLRRLLRYKLFIITRIDLQSSI